MEFPPSLSAKYTDTFAYDTVKDRIPRILTKVIDVCHRQIPNSLTAYGQEGKDDNIEVVGMLSKLRNEIMTDKELTLLEDSFSDVTIWNKRLTEYREFNKRSPSWFTAPWLYVECFMYRKIFNILISRSTFGDISSTMSALDFSRSVQFDGNFNKYLRDFDPFKEQKNQALQQSMTAINNLALHLSSIVEANSTSALQQNFIDLLQISLWGNKCDLSISGGDDNAQTVLDLHKNLESFYPDLLVDDSNLIWKHLEGGKKSNKQVRVDIVLDNSGFELYTDLVLADFLLTSGLCHQVVFHPKSMPWFVSDVTPIDFKSTLEYLSSSTPAVANLSKKWVSYLAKQKIVLVEDKELLQFWTLPDPYYKLSSVSPKLHEFLSQSHLIIFKGDLNYRKLVGDLDWSHEIKFAQALRGFAPSSLCSLRTLKANVVVGLKPGVAGKTASQDEDWMVTGKYAVIQFNK